MITKKDVRDIIRLGDAVADTRILGREPQRAYMFEVLVFDTSYNTALSELKYYVKEVEIPAQSREQISSDFLDTKIYYAGKDNSTHTLNITFWDDQSLVVTDYLQKWYDLTGDQRYNETVQKEGYIKHIEIRLKDTTDLMVTGSFKFFNCFPIELSSTTVSYDDSNVYEKSCIFSYDYMSFGESQADFPDVRQVLDVFGL